MQKEYTQLELDLSTSNPPDSRQPYRGSGRKSAKLLNYEKQMWNQLVMTDK